MKVEWRWQQEDRRGVWATPQLKDYHFERERQRVTQAKLLERLRYKDYIRRGTLSSFMQWLGDSGRSLLGFIQ